MPYPAPDARVSGEALLAAIRGERARFDAVVAQVPAERLTEPALPGGWSVRDVLAHVAWGDREAVGVMEARALVGSELWELSEDERNEAVVQESRRLALDEVLAEYRAAFDRFVEAIAALSEEDLNEPARFAGLPDRIPGWRPWRVLHDPTHYAEHGEAIRAAFGIPAPPGDRST